ncbi:MAG: efflux transporter outer membrane subunit [Acetobacteraceae bacterium]|nr:efflux transporter outer membrane subunit [Acetobacteraceae bacterium]
MRAFRLLLSLSGLSLAGCTVGPNFQMPSWASPATWFASHAESGPTPSVAVTEPVDPRWWHLFRDKELSSLVERVGAGNLDVRLATIRLAESRGQRGIAASDLFPTLNGNGSYSREKISNRGAISLFGAGGGSGSGGAGGAASGGGVNTGANGLSGQSGAIPTTVTGGQKLQPFNLWQYGFDASWELDLWGRVRRSVESADASVDASEEARRASLLSSIAEVASDYIQLRGAQAALQIARDNLKSAQESLTLTQQRAAGGVTNELDVANAQAQVRSTAAEIPQYADQEARLINALSLLLGQEPQALRGELERAKPIPPVPPRVPVGLPSELARRRPDIVQAEAQLHAATADIGVAVANFYPSVTLSGSLGIQALRFKDLGNWDARQYSLGPAITVPLFEGGRLRATLELRKAQQQEAAVTYQRTVLNAWHEVDNALTAYEKEQRRRDDLAQAVASNRAALGLAQDRYRAGVADFLQVLTAQRDLLAAQQALAASTTNVSNDLVALYKALGGGWETDFPRTKTASVRS